MMGSVTTPKYSVEIVYHGPWRILSQWYDCGVNSVGQGLESEKENGKTARLINSIFSHHCTLNRLFQSIKMCLVLYWPYIFKKYLNLLGEKNLSFFWKSCWSACICWRAASENGGEGKSADWLFTVVQIDSVRPAFEALIQVVSVLHGAPSPSPPLCLGHHLPTNMPGIDIFLPEPPELPSTNHKYPQPWAHWCEPMSNTCFSSVAVHANHNTHLIWSLSSSQSQHTRGTGFKKYGFYRWEQPFQRITFLSTNVTANAPCIIASLENSFLE